MYSDDIIKVGMAGGGRDGFLISYISDLGKVAGAKPDSDTKEIRHLNEPWVTRYSPTAKAAAEVIAAILDKAAKDATKNSPKDAFDKAFRMAIKEV